MASLEQESEREDFVKPAQIDDETVLYENVMSERKDDELPPIAKQKKLSAGELLFQSGYGQESPASKPGLVSADQFDHETSS